MLGIFKTRSKINAIRWQKTYSTGDSLVASTFLKLFVEHPAAYYLAV